MSATTTLDRIGRARVVPLITLDDAAVVDDLADALLAAGVSVVEITLRTAAGMTALEKFARHDALTVGAGTVVRTEQVDEAAAAGATFVVSPGIDEHVVAAARRLDLAALPGTATATDVQTAARLGLDAVKLFPAALLGGTAMVDALRGPFPAMRFFASGGIRADDARTYLAHPGVLAVSGSWMVPAALVAERRWSRITDLCREATTLVDER